VNTNVMSHRDGPRSRIASRVTRVTATLLVVIGVAGALCARPAGADLVTDVGGVHVDVELARQATTTKTTCKLTPGAQAPAVYGIDYWAGLRCNRRVYQAVVRAQLMTCTVSPVGIRYCYQAGSTTSTSGHDVTSLETPFGYYHPSPAESVANNFTVVARADIKIKAGYTLASPGCKVDPDDRYLYHCSVQSAPFTWSWDGSVPSVMVDPGVGLPIDIMPE
jgi:hypothetical protein